MNKIIFIIGAPRSGTKLLRDCFKNILHIKIIPYDIGFFWEKYLKLTNKNYIKKIFYSFYIKKNYKYIIEKSISNPKYIKELKKVFPDAKFILIIRNGNYVIQSNFKQWQIKPSLVYLLNKLPYMKLINVRYAFDYILCNFFFTKQKIYGYKYSGIENDIKNFNLETICCLQWINSVNDSFKHLNEIKNKDKTIVSYEELTLNPHKAFQRINNILKLNKNELNQIKKNISNTNRGNLNKPLEKNFINKIDKKIYKNFLNLQNKLYR